MAMKRHECILGTGCNTYCSIAYWTYCDML